MIKSFWHNGLKRYWNRGQAQRIPANMRDEIADLLGALEDATALEDLNQPGYGFHRLTGFRPTRYSLTVRGNWRITFAWNGPENAVEHVDLEDYHTGHH